MKNLGQAKHLKALAELVQDVIEVHSENEGKDLTWEGDDSGALTILDTDGRRVAVIHNEHSD